MTGVTIENEGDLFSTITTLSKTKKEYDKIAYALEEVNAKGYGIVTPSMDELILDEPEMIKQGSRFGVKLRATAPSIHIECIKQKCKVPTKEKQYSNRNNIQRTALHCCIKRKITVYKRRCFNFILVLLHQILGL